MNRTLNGKRWILIIVVLTSLSLMVVWFLLAGTDSLNWIGAMLPDQTTRVERLTSDRNSEPLVVVVAGSVPKTVPGLAWATDRFYAHFGVDSGPGMEAGFPQHLADSSDFDVWVFHWSGGITRGISIEPAGRALADALVGQDRPVVVVGKSLGGQVAEIAACRTNQVQGILQIATPHRGARSPVPDRARVVNIFSEADNYVPFARTVLYAGRGKNELKNAENIEIPGLRHGQFNSEVVPVGTEDVRPFERYLACINKIILEADGTLTPRKR